ncbi:hypothetical protein Csa_020611 [Cucumis sativus]|nr:hypothetical protein Csa_020611 [Cucumis sativus]
MDDIFDSSLNLEEAHLKEGYADGYKDGLVAGKEEAEQVGLKVGFEVGEELGFYRGCVDVWNSVIRIEPERFSIRVRKSVKLMEELLEKYPLQDPENEQVQELMEGLRLKFRAVYISESRNKAALESIERATKLFPDAPIINKFTDEVYNRVGYTLVSKLPSHLSGKSCSLISAVLNMVKAAFSAIDFNSHCGSHPRLGVVDHICFHPLASATLEDAALIAKYLAADVGYSLQVPTFLYGAAHEEGRKLAVIRRELGYFKPNSEGSKWAGGLKSDSLPLKPDDGPAEASKAKGVVVIGATKWVDNYNVPVFSTNISAVRKIAKQVSERGGGLSSVQAMALAHDEGVIEVACNLLEPSKVGGKMVQQEVERLAENEGLGVGEGYFTDLSQESIIERVGNSANNLHYKELRGSRDSIMHQK